MAKASDNIFPKIIEAMNPTDPAAPLDSSWKVYAKANGIFARSSNSIVGPFSTGAGGGIATDTIWDAAGDLVQGTGADTAAKLSAGTVGQFLMSGGAAAANAWASREIDYVQYTSPVSITATSEATADNVVTATATAFNGSTVVFVEFFTPLAATPTGNQSIVFDLYDGSSSIGHIGQLTGPDATNLARSSLHCFRRLTPSNATHTYSIRAWVTSGTGNAGAGAGGNGNYQPGFIRITRAV